MDKYVLAAVNASQYAAILVQVDTVFKWIQLGLALLCSGVLLAYRIWKWVKDSKADGKIDESEVDELVNIIKDGAEDIKSNLDKSEKE